MPDEREYRLYRNGLYLKQTEEKISWVTNKSEATKIPANKIYKTRRELERRLEITLNQKLVIK